MSKVNESNTKAQILAAYTEAVATIERLQNAKLDPAGEVAAKKASQTLNNAQATVEGSVADKITALQKNIVNVLGSLSGQLTEEIETFNNLQSAISLKEAELKELFGIEKEAFALAALINAQNEQKAKHKADQDELYAEAVAKLNEVNSKAQAARIEAEAALAKQKVEAEVARKREEEEYKYNFNRKKQQAEDALQDQLNARRKEFNAEVEAEQAEIEAKLVEVESREIAVKTREAKIDALEAQVAAFPAREAQIREEVETQVRKDEARTMAIKENYIKKDAESKVAILDNKIAMLEESLRDEKVRNAEIAAKLDEAYAKMQAMALKSVESSNDSKAFDRFQNMISDKNQK